MGIQFKLRDVHQDLYSLYQFWKTEVPICFPEKIEENAIFGHDLGKFRNLMRVNTIIICKRGIWRTTGRPSKG